MIQHRSKGIVHPVALFVEGRPFLNQAVKTFLLRDLKELGGGGFVFLVQNAAKFAQIAKAVTAPCPIGLAHGAGRNITAQQVKKRVVLAYSHDGLNARMPGLLQ
jgi:hypothetical protein